MSYPQRPGCVQSSRQFRSFRGLPRDRKWRLGARGTSARDEREGRRRARRGAAVEHGPRTRVASFGPFAAPPTTESGESASAGDERGGGGGGAEDEREGRARQGGRQGGRRRGRRGAAVDLGPAPPVASFGPFAGCRGPKVATRRARWARGWGGGWGGAGGAGRGAGRGARNPGPALRTSCRAARGAGPPREPGRQPRRRWRSRSCRA